MRNRSKVASVLVGACLVLGSGLAGCSKGSALRVTTTAAVKATLKDHNINYRGDITCRGTQLPIACTGQATDGRPIQATLAASSSNACKLNVLVGGQNIAQTSGSRCK